MAMKNIAPFLLLTLSTTGCALIAHGRYQAVHVQSTPSGASVQVDCADAPRSGGVTPAEVKLRRGARHCALTLVAPGYDPHIVTFTRVSSRVVWSNLAPGLLLGAVAGAAAATPLSDDNSGNTAAISGIVVGASTGALIDRTSGAAYRQVPSSVDVQLRRQKD